jgi:AraC-like DNA-binding protein
MGENRMMKIAFGKIILREESIREKQYCYSYSSKRGLKILKVINGSIKVNTISRLQEGRVLTKGQFEFVNIDQYVEKECLEKNCRVFMLDIDYEWLKENGYDMEKVYLFSYVLMKSYEYQGHVKNFDQMIDSIYNSYKCNDEITVEEIIGIVNYLIEHFDYIKFGVNYKKMSNRIVDRYRDIFFNTVNIEGKYYSKNLKYISEDIDKNYSYLRKDIKRRYGINYSKLKKQRMVRVAARLIIDSDLNLSDIAHMAGFSDHKYFIKHFQEVFKCKPSEYRKIVYNNSSNNNTEE